VTRKIVQTGSSLAVTLPREVVDRFKLKKGDDVDVSVHPQTGAIIVRPGVQHVDGGKATGRVKRLAAELRRRRAGLYSALAKE
jgi:antitoxin component of MazEF toxin-antitoxin module